MYCSVMLLCAVGVLAHGAICAEVPVSIDEVDPTEGQPDEVDLARSKLAVPIKKLPVDLEDEPDDPDQLESETTSTTSPAKELFVPYTISDDTRRGRARHQDPFGGCRLRCPRGFVASDYHIHMHKWNRKIQKGGRDPVHGIWHHDWKERAE